MPGRRLLTEEQARQRGYGRDDFVRRRSVLRETLAAFEGAAEGHYQGLARDNLARWRAQRGDAESPTAEVRVLPGDWGAATLQLTRELGQCFAVLNMANAYSPGGAYVEGTAAQEENMFRRTDCHFRVGADEIDAATDRYRPKMTALLSATDGAVYLDTEAPRVCLRGPEDRARDDLGYPWLADDEIFPFFELRAAAVDLRRAGPGAFDPEEARRRIAAQLDTLRTQGIRHAVLSAFGCGAFHNPADRVAQLYRDELETRGGNFALIAFAIFHPGYGPDNFSPFAKAFSAG